LRVSQAGGWLIVNHRAREILFVCLSTDTEAHGAGASAGALRRLPVTLVSTFPGTETPIDTLGGIHCVSKIPALMGLLSGVEGGESQKVVGEEVDETHPVSRFLVPFLGLAPAGPVS